MSDSEVSLRMEREEESGNVACASGEGEREDVGMLPPWSSGRDTHGGIPSSLRCDFGLLRSDPLDNSLCGDPESEV